jgi:hypothetical protein
MCIGAAGLLGCNAMEMKTLSFSERWYLPPSPYSVTTEKTNRDIFTAVRTSDITQFVLRFFSDITITLQLPTIHPLNV